MSIFGLVGDIFDVFLPYADQMEPGLLIQLSEYCVLPDSAEHFVGSSNWRIIRFRDPIKFSVIDDSTQLTLLFYK